MADDTPDRLLKWNYRHGDVHVLPIHDLREHLESRRCWCEPTVTKEPDAADAVVTHHSLDGRELVEQHGVH